MICTFFGHKDAPESIEPLIKETLTKLIQNNNVTLFLVGNNGNFDYMVHKQLRSLSHIFSIKYYIVKAYIHRPENDFDDPENTIVSDKAETVPPKFAISHRNQWMLNQADYVVTYVAHSSSGAAKFKTLAEKKEKNIINIYSIQQEKEVTENP